MDITDNLEDIIPESNFDTDVSPETSEKDIISKLSHLDDIPIAAVDDVQNIENVSDEQTLLLKSDATDKDVHVATPNKEVGDCIGENYLKTCVTTDPVITSTNVSPVDKPLLEFLNITSNNDNSVKSSNDDENNSDMLDEELQLRWDDDENDGDNVIDSAEEEELLQERGDICVGMGEKEYTETKDLNICPNDAIEEKTDMLISDKSDVINRDIPTDSIQKIEEIVTQHGLRKPDMMLEIPTQELIDFMDEDEEPDLLSNLEMSPNNKEGIEDKDLDKIDLSNAELQLENVVPITTETVVEVSKKSEDIISADVSESSKQKEKEDDTEIISKTLKEPIESKSDENQINVKVVDESQPSTSKASIMEMRRDSDEVGEMSDSLGLLAESTRVVEDDEDQDEEDDDDDGDDEDYDPDEETSTTTKRAAEALPTLEGQRNRLTEQKNSNQMVAEYSEDSNAVNSETDVAKVGPKESNIAEDTKDAQQADLPISDKQNETFELMISDVKSQDDYNKNVTENTQQMESSDVTAVQGEKNDEDNEMVETMILDKILEQENAEPSQSTTEDPNMDNDHEEVTNKLPEDSEQGVFVIDDENSVPVDEVQSPTLPETELKNDNNVVLLESSSEDENELNDEKENTTNISPEKTQSMVNDVNTNTLSPSKENDKEVEVMETDDIGSPEKAEKQTSKVPIGLEVFNVDSDEDEVEPKSDEVTCDIVEKLPPSVKCCNPLCQTPNDAKFYAAEPELLKFYEIDHKRKASVCETCLNEFEKHIQVLLTRFKNLTPLLELDTGKSKQELVEIYDSDSEEEEETIGSGEKIGSSAAKFLEDNLADVFNESWEKYKMNSRLTDSQNELQHQLNKIEEQTSEIDKILKECQAATDLLRNNVYSMFRVDRRELPAIILVDTPNNTYCCYEGTQSNSNQSQIETRNKRRLTASADIPAKRVALPDDTKEYEQENKMEVNAPEPIDDDNVDVSVVKLSAEAAPPDLPPPGEVVKPPLKVGMAVYTMKSTFGFWIKAKIVEVMTKPARDQCTAVGDGRVNSEASNKSTEYCASSGLTALKEGNERSRNTQNDKVPKVKKIPKTGAERIRAYRERIRAYEREVAARSANNIVSADQTDEYNIKQIAIPEPERTLLRDVLNQPIKDEEVDNKNIVIEVEISPQALPQTLNPLTQKQTGSEVKMSRKHLKIAKSPAERAREYRERKKALKNDVKQQLMNDTIHSKVVNENKVTDTQCGANEHKNMLEQSSEANSTNSASSKFTVCRVKLEYKFNKNPYRQVPARCLAYAVPPDVRLIIGTRIIASAGKTESFYSGVVAEVPNPVNKFRYLVFFDDGHAKYVHHANTRLVCECSSLVWEEVHPFSKDFVRQYLLSYPERPMVRLRPKQKLKTEWQGKWWSSRVLQVDASLVEIMLSVRPPRREWIYRGSTRLSPLYLELQAAERHRARPVPRSGPQIRPNMPYVEYTRYDEPSKSPNQTLQQTEEIRRQRAVAKKSTTSQPQPPPHAPPANAALDNVISRVVHYKPKNAVCPLRMVPHECGPHCRRSDVLPLKDLRTYNPLAKPLLSGWERQLVRYKAHKEVMYRAPCGRRLRNMRELHRYLRAVRSDMSVDLFDFSPNTHCLAEFVLNNCLVGKKDLSHGKENVPVPCVNYYDESLPEFCSYNTERTPTAGVPLNLDPDFLCGCDCEDDCEDKSKCACWKMTLDGARTIGIEGDAGYVYRRLPEPLLTGIYECNSRCKCSNTCLNRVAQQPLQLKLQVFKTLHRGWGIRALNDVPKGTFLCVYAGNLLTDATANLDGLNEGDEYLAELDFIEVAEQMKEGFEEDIPETLKDQKSGSNYTTEEDEESTDDEDSKTSKDEQDDDFRPSYVDVPSEFNKHLRTRERRKQGTEDDADKDKDKEKEKEKGVEEEVKNDIQKDVENENGDEDCITISDDEEVREPSRFTVQAGMDSKELISKHRSVRSYFGKDEACYIMDAKVQGNIGRYLNHSCCPNVFVQNVFVDTHDPRFPWVAFFALTHIRAGTELTWNYNYDVGSVPGKVLHCYCGADNCRGRLL